MAKPPKILVPSHTNVRMTESLHSAKHRHQPLLLGKCWQTQRHQQSQTADGHMDHIQLQGYTHAVYCDSENYRSVRTAKQAGRRSCKDTQVTCTVIANMHRSVRTAGRAGRRTCPLTEGRHQPQTVVVELVVRRHGVDTSPGRTQRIKHL